VQVGQCRFAASFMAFLSEVFMPAVSLTEERESRLKSVARRAISALVKVGWPLAPRLAYLGRFPFHMSVALTRKCNANCVFCAYQFAQTSDKIHMATPIFERLVTDIARSGVKQVMLSPNIGEPTIAPNFIEKVSRFREAGVEFIEMTSNALYWHKVGLDALIERGPDKINISFAGFDREMYERDYRVTDYEQTRENIMGLLRLNDARGRPRKISLWLRGDRSIEQLTAAPEMEEARALAFDVSVMTEVDDWLGLIEADKLPEGYKLQGTRALLTRRPCSLLFDLTIHPDGDIHLCSCRNVSGDPDMHIGNLADMSLEEAHRAIPGVLSKWERGHVPKSCGTCSMYTDPAVGLAGRSRAIVAAGALRSKNVVSSPVDSAERWSVSSRA
jgi:MoaA/NifB/PqqE/SkfB family radical SAM enzyme